MSKLTRRICLARAALIKHVVNGGSITPSWPNQVPGVPKNLGSVERRRAFDAADEFTRKHIDIGLRALSLDNFYDALYSAHHYDNGRSAY